MKTVRKLVDILDHAYKIQTPSNNINQNNNIKPN